MGRIFRSPSVADCDCWLGRIRNRIWIDAQKSVREDVSGGMIYVKSILIGSVMVMVAFGLVFAFMLRHADSPALAPRSPTNADVGFELRSTWTETPAWPPLLVGVSTFGGGFYWT